MTQQKMAWFVQYKDNREIIVVKIIICYLNPFTTTTKFFISILKLGLLKGKMNREHNILEITKSSNALDNF
jgi:hypothetical protein